MRKLIVKAAALALGLFMLAPMTTMAAGSWGTHHQYGIWGGEYKPGHYLTIVDPTNGDPVHYERKNAANKTIDSSVPTSIPGIYKCESVKGVAITTPTWKMLQQYDCQLADNLIATVFDTSAESVDAKATVETIATAMGAQVGACIDARVAKLTGSKKIVELTEATETYQLMIGIPDSIKADGNTYAAIRVREGGVVDILPDLEVGKGVLTIETTPALATYAIVAIPQK